VVHNAYGYGLFTGGVGLHHGGLRLGAMVVPGIGDNSLKTGVFGAEPWTNQMRALVEELLDIRALDIYGLSEIIGRGWHVSRWTPRGC
jgi:phenylacetate-CoA ligase